MSQAGQAEAFTDDRLLDGRVLLRQPARGFRAGSDAVFLAAAVAARSGELVVDIGSAHGPAALCLAWRCPEVTVTGLDRQADLIALAKDNADRNRWSDRVRFVCSDLAHALALGPFDHAMTNPPYRRVGNRSPDRAREAARHEGELALADWIDRSAALIRPGGSLTVIFTAARASELIAAMQRHLGDLLVRELWSRRAGPAELVIVRGLCGGASELRRAPAFIVHRDDQRFTEEAEDILRGGAALSLAAPLGPS